MKFLKNQPLETYLLIALPALRLVVLTISEPQLLITSISDSLKVIMYYLLFGGEFLVYAFVLIYFYLMVKIIWSLGNSIIERFRTGHKSFLRNSLPAIKSTAFLVLGISISLLFIAAEITNVLEAPKERVIFGSNFLMNLDYTIFGVYPAFLNLAQASSNFMQNLSLFFIFIYHSLAYFVSIIFVALLIANKELFRKYVLVFFLTTAISFPMWYSLPAISPHFMYQHNVFGASLPNNIETTVKSFEYPPALADYVDKIKFAKEQQLKESSDPSQNFYPYTTFPSMHGAWGIMIAYFATKLWKPLGLIAIPWAVLNAVSGVYTQWHYAVDMLLGTFVAFVVIGLVNYLMRIEKKFLSKETYHFTIIDVIQTDLRKVFQVVKETTTLPRLRNSAIPPHKRNG